ncbi:hypothetical protein SAMN02910451_01638 [Butyrivibrio hungatei]|uniref:DUF2845 domain-containing protein n=1 Tax=Butyrivibrio hungatei TaxID=185008 RepID=A0A1G5DTX1_9FIRM|nr:hypothetical protein [Butyrivibrio hungatei]SCY17778.1 hypothetical protein SAMN02910451_01638 [Butyrivibrio hungatei]
MSIIILFYFAFLFILGACIVIAYVIKLERRKCVDKIHVGMSESKMFKIMGRRYNKSLLKNGRVKYEWRYSNGGRYRNVIKVDIYCKNGCVEEVRSHNL